MSILFKIPPVDKLVDRQFFQVPYSDGLLVGYQYDAETRTLVAKESQIIIPSRHGMTHVGEDPVPDATCDSPGLMSSDDKCKLDTLLQTRLGVLGYQGAGFPDDGGYIVGDIILAAGNEFISLERIGNTVRFTVDATLPLNCSCETCSQIFWIQDESEARGIRPPSCNGVMPDVCAYGELKIYTFPESLLIDPKDPMAALSQKGNFPALIFKRYDNALTPYENEFHTVLKRNSNGTTHTGWDFTPGPALARAQLVWWTGHDKNDGQIKFEMWPEHEPNLLGSVLYNGHLITKKAAVIVDYDANVLVNNKYVLRLWDVKNAAYIGDRFTATNTWRYVNPESNFNAQANPKMLVKDATIDLLPIGCVVDIWEFEINRTADTRLTQAFFMKQPELNPAALWSLNGAVQFGDLLSARYEVNQPKADSAEAASEINIHDKRIFERTIWGLNNFEDRLLLSDDGGEVEACDGLVQREPRGEPINNDVVAEIDPTIPGLKVIKQQKPLICDINGDGKVDDEDLRLFMCSYGKTVFDKEYNPRCDFNQDGKVDIRDLAIFGECFNLNVEKVTDRPVFLWHRQNHKNTLIKTKIGQPRASSAIDAGVHFPPYDMLLAAPVDSFEDTYMKIIKRGVITTGPFAGAPYVVCKGVEWKELPSEGVLRILTGVFRDSIWRYYWKTAFSNWDDDSVMLIGMTDVFPFDEDFPVGAIPVECTVCNTGGFGPGGTLVGTDCTHGPKPPSTDFTSVGSCGPEAVEVPTNTTVVELLRHDYTSPIVRMQFVIDQTSKQIQLQFKVGVLDMSVPYEMHVTDSEDDLVRGLAPGYMVSKVLLQNGFITDGIGSGVTSTPSGFRTYMGGELPAPVQGQTEKWNDLEVMYRDGQVWIWWNSQIIPPDTQLSAQLPTPVAVNTPYFPINPQLPIGKIALRMFPGAVVRNVEIRDQERSFNEFTNGGLTLSN
jgi:hypothetical protein